MKFDFYFACDQLNSTNRSTLFEVSSSSVLSAYFARVYTQLYLHGQITFHFLSYCVHPCKYSCI